MPPYTMQKKLDKAHNKMVVTSQHERGTMKQFNHNSIRIIREARSLSREQLADMIGASRQLVYLWETGKHCPSADYLASIISALGLKSTDIFFVNDDQHNVSQQEADVVAG